MAGSLDDLVRETMERVAREVIERHAAKATDPLQVLGVATVAELLDLEEDTARTWMASGKLKAFKMEGHWRMYRVDLEAFLRDRAAGSRDVPNVDEVAARLARDMRRGKKAG